MKTVNHIKDLISQNKIELAFSKLQDLSNSNLDLSNQLVLLKGQWNSIVHSELVGISTSDEINRNKSKIRLSLLSLTDSISINKQNPNKLEKNIYFSYAWSDSNETQTSREAIVNDLYDRLHEIGYNLRRDKMNLGYRGLISEFMHEIGKGTIIIVAISHKYLRSPYCMFELYEIYRNSKLEKKEFSERIFPIHVESINLNDPIILDEYYTYWEEQENTWSKLIQKRIDKIGKQQFAEYDKIKQISSNFGDLTSFLMDMNALNLEVLSENNFDKMITAIDNKLNEN